jgi:hypothetical protein
MHTINNKLLRNLFLIGLPMLMMMQSCQTEHEINPDILNKLDARLQLMVLGNEVPESALTPVSHNTEGDPVYRVIVRTDDAGSLRDAGLSFNAVIGPVATARWTRHDILKAAAHESTHFIEPDSEQNFPENFGQTL